MWAYLVLQQLVNLLIAQLTKNKLPTAYTIIDNRLII